MFMVDIYLKGYDNDLGLKSYSLNAETMDEAIEEVWRYNTDAVEDGWDICDIITLYGAGEISSCEIYETSDSVDYLKVRAEKIKQLKLNEKNAQKAKEERLELYKQLKEEFEGFEV